MISVKPRSEWEKDWLGEIPPGQSNLQARMSQFKAWLPYLLIALILIITRIEYLQIKTLLYRDIILPINNILGQAGVAFTVRPLYNPGVIPFMIVGIITIFLHGMSSIQVKNAWIQSVSRMKNPFIALLFAVAMVEIFKQTANVSGLSVDHPVPGVQPPALSMPLTLATAMAQIAGQSWPFFAAFIGALGSFITGSNTVSNMLFAEFQFGIAGAVGTSRQIIVALQAVGGAMGNMICVHNVVAASATVGLVGLEGLIIRRTIIPMLLYGVLVGSLGLLFAYIIFPGVF